MTTTFLDDKRLGAAIAEIMLGKNVRCAVAFWGTGAVEHLFASAGLPADAQIVCDISIGATNPKELRAMRAPSNRRLKHVERLHAKVYISDRGAIVCSANASDNGIGFVDVAGLVEAGMLVAPKSTAFGQVESWFKRIWRRSRTVDQPALDRATDAWNRRPRGGGAGRGLSIERGSSSLLATVAADPERFRGIGFVFTNGRADEEERDEACGELERRDNERREKLLSRDERRRLVKWNVDDLFTGWSEADLDAWPRRFVCIHRPGRHASYWFYQRVYDVMLADGRGVIFAERPRGLRAQLGFEHGREAMMKTDAALLEKIFSYCEERGHWLCEDGARLLQLIDQVEGA